MELRLDEIRNSSDPYEMFLDSVKSPQTRRKYKNALNEFLKLVPSKIYEEELETIPQDRDPKTLAKFFVNLTRKNPASKFYPNLTVWNRGGNSIF